jgi:hypothetical protein
MIPRAALAFAVALLAVEVPAAAAYEQGNLAPSWGQLVRRTAALIYPQPETAQVKEAALAALAGAEDRPALDQCVKQQDADWSNDIRHAARLAFACRPESAAFDFTAGARAFLRALSPHADYRTMDEIVADTAEAEARAADRDAQMSFANGLFTIRISSFEEGLADTIVRTILRDGNGDNWRATVIDLSGNKGGLLDEVQRVADLFLDKGTIFTLVGNDPSDIDHRMAQRGDVSGGRSLAVIIDGGSENGAEILASVMQNRCRAALFGQASAGRVVIRTALSLDSNGMVILPTGAIKVRPGMPMSGPVIPGTRLMGDPESWPAQAAAQLTGTSKGSCDADQG